MSKDQRNTMMDVLRLAYSQNSDLAGEDNNGVRVTIYNHELLDVINQIKQFRLKPNHESIRAYLETKRGDRQAIPIDITPKGKWDFTPGVEDYLQSWVDLVNKQNQNK